LIKEPEYNSFCFDTSWMDDVDQKEEFKYYDSVTGIHLFTAPKGRSVIQFMDEALEYGYPCFRDNEVEWENVRCLRNGLVVSIDGTFLGVHKIDD